jgi:hypothetical protein
MDNKALAVDQSKDWLDLIIMLIKTFSNSILKNYLSRLFSMVTVLLQLYGRRRLLPSIAIHSTKRVSFWQIS